MLNRAELRRYIDRVRDRWRLDAAFLGGTAVTDTPTTMSAAVVAPAPREREPRYVVILISDAYDSVPWLERVRVAGSLWDALEMGAPAEIHCYTSAEFKRHSTVTPHVRAAVTHGIDLLALRDEPALPREQR